MQTKVKIDDALYADARRLALTSNRTVGALIEEGLRKMVARQPKPQTRRKAVLRTFKGNGLKQGVDIDNGRQLRDLMEGVDGST